MPKYRRLPSENSCPKIDWFKDLDLPQGRTFKCDKREVIQLDHIERENENGDMEYKNSSWRKSRGNDTFLYPFLQIPSFQPSKK